MSNAIEIEAKALITQDEYRKICELYNAGLDERYAWD